MRLVGYVLASILATACTADPEAPPRPAASGPPTPVAASADSTVWLTRDRILDFTGDGIADTVRLTAVGNLVDSLRISLTFLSGEVERWSTEWGSEYELVIPAAPVEEAARAEHLRKRLDRTMASIQVEPFNRIDYVTMAQPVDSAVLRDPPAQQVRFSYGYESTVVLAWDPVAGRLRVVHACC